MRRFAWPVLVVLLLGFMPQQSQAQRIRDRSPQTATQVIQDRSGNPLLTPAGQPINYIVEPHGYAKIVLNADGTELRREPLSANPFTQPHSTDVQSALPAPQAEPGPYLTPTWRTGIWGTGIGVSGINVQDLDGDGTLEVILAGGSGFGANRFWYIVSYLAPESRYQQVWMSQYYSSSISQITTADANNDGHPEIYVALTSGQLEIYDAASRVLQTTLSTGLANLAAVVIVDANEDGANEILVSSSAGTKAFEPDTNTELWSIAQGGSDIAVGNVDADPNLEIVTNSYVIDSQDHSIKWSNSFGSWLNVADVDGDGQAEIIASQGWYKIRGFDAELKTQAWEINTSIDIGTVLVANIDTDSQLEIIYGDNQWGAVHVLDGPTRQQEWQITNPEHGTTNVGFGDVDSDGVNELLWGAGWTSTGADYLYIASTETHMLEWRSTDVGGPLSALDVGDVDGDGQQEIVMVSFESNSGYSDGLIFIYDARTHNLEWQSGPLLNGAAWTGMRALKLGDVDNDGRPDIVVATAQLYDGVILVYDGLTKSLKWRSASYGSTAFNALAIADVDNDGQVEVIGGQNAETTGSSGARVVVFDGATGTAEWQTVSHGYWNGVNNIVVDDIDGNGNPDIMFVSEHVAFIYDGVTHTNLWQSPNNVEVIRSANVDADPEPELLLALRNGHINIYDGRTRQLERDVPISNAPLTALRIGDMDHNGQPELFATSATYLYVYDVSTWTLLWQSRAQGGALGRHDHLVVQDIDNDSRDDVVVGDMLALNVFSFSALPYLVQLHVDREIIKPGDMLTYTAKLSNLTSTTATLRLTDTVPLNTLLLTESVTASIGIPIISNQHVTWVGAVPASSTMTLTLRVRSAASLTDGSLVENHVDSDNSVFQLSQQTATHVDAIGPQVLMVSPSSAEILSGTTTIIHGTASDNQAGVDQIEIKIGAADWQVAEGRTTWALTWTLPFSDTNMPLLYRATDRVGNVTTAATATLVVVDNLAPTLVQTIPAHGDSSIARDQPIVLTFSEPIIPETLAWVCQNDPGGWQVTPLNDGYTFKLDHNLFEANQLYTCVVSTAQDKAGHRLQPGLQPNPWAFGTQAGLLYHIYLPLAATPKQD